MTADRPSRRRLRGPRQRRHARGARTPARICIVRQRDYYELPVRREAEALHEAGFDVDVVCLRGEAGPALEVDNGVTLHRLPLRRRRGGPLGYLWDYVAFFLAATVKVAALHLRRPFRAVQANTMPDILAFTALVPRLLGAKVVVFMKEPTPELGLTKYGSARLAAVLRLVERAALRFSDLAFTVTDDLKEVYVARGADPDKIAVVLNCPDERHLLQHRSNSVPDPRWFTAICHGLVDERYGHDTMVGAIGLARRQIPDLRLLITGVGDYVPELQALVEREGLQDCVHYLGWLDMPELVDTLCRADVGIVAQKSSPYSNLVHTNKMYEYMLLEKPVVASRLRSTARYFDDASVQYFEPGSPESLAEALVALHADPGRRQALAAAGLEKCRVYGWGVQQQIFLAAYARLLGADLHAVTGGLERAS